MGRIGSKSLLTAIALLCLSASLRAYEPSFIYHPWDVTTCPAHDATFWASVTDADSLHWEVDSSGTWEALSNDGVYSGVQTDTLRISYARSAMNGYRYRLLAHADTLLGEPEYDVYSDPATLTVDNACIIVHPADKGYCPGDAVQLQALAHFRVDIRWQVNSGGTWEYLSDGGIYSGTDTDQLTISSVGQDMAGYRYRILAVSAGDDSTFSADATLTPYQPPAIATHPTNASACPSTTASFSVTATGDNLMYSWQRSTDGGQTFHDMSQNYSTLEVTAYASMDGYQYRCHVTTSKCNWEATSDPATLSLLEPPQVVDHPVATEACEGGSATFTAGGTGEAVAYQWQVYDGGYVDLTDDGTHAGVNTTTLTIDPVSLSMQNKTYRCMVSGACAPADSTLPATLTVRARPVITAQSDDTTVCETQTAQFGVDTEGDNPTYQWQVDEGSGFVDLANTGPYSHVDGPWLWINDAPASLDGARYRCVVGGACSPQVVSTPVTLTVQALPRITADPQPDAVCHDGTASFSVSATGDGLSYRWYVDKGDGNGFQQVTLGNPTATSPTLTLNNPGTHSDGNRYRCQVAGTCSPVAVSADALLTIYAPITITDASTYADVCENQPATFSVTVSGHEPSYQWQMDDGSGFVDLANDAVYSGADTDQLTIAAATLSMSGQTYRCEVGGPCSSPVYSYDAALTVRPAPGITSEPSDITVCPSASAFFEVQATGASGSPAYQWQVSTGGSFTDLQDNAPYSGATSTHLSISGVTEAMNGYRYRCIVSGECSPQATSAVATLSVQTEAQITSQPTSTSSCQGYPVTLTVEASGPGLSYQWQYDPGGSGFYNIPAGAGYEGITTSTLLIASASTAMNDDRYRCIVSSSCGAPVTSNEVTISVDAPPVIITDPYGGTACEDGVKNLTVAALGSGLLYQWQVNDGGGFVDVADGSPYSNVTSATMSIDPVPVAFDGYQYRCVVSTATCTNGITSGTATIDVMALPVITTHPRDTGSCGGADVRFAVTATGDALTYQWERNAGSGFSAVSEGGTHSGVTTATLTISNPTEYMNGHIYRCRIRNTCAVDRYSDEATLHVGDPIAIVSQPADQHLCEGASVRIYVGATGAGPSYRWQIEQGGAFVDLTEGTPYVDVNTSNMLLGPAEVSMDGAQYRCVLSNACSPQVISDTFTVTVDAKPAIVSAPRDTAVCVGDDAGFTVEATGTNLVYRWTYMDAHGSGEVQDVPPYSGATTPTLSISGATLAMNGTRYWCTVTGDCSPSTGAGPAVLSVGEPPSITAHPTDTTICPANSTSFSVQAAGAGVSYQWQMDDGSGFVDLSASSVYPDVNASTLYLTAPSSTLDGAQYRCVVSSACPVAPAVSDAAVLTFEPAPSLVGQPKDTAAASGSWVQFTVEVDAPDTSWKQTMQFQWQVDRGSGFEDISGTGYIGERMYRLSVVDLTIDMDGNQFRCLVTNDCGQTTQSQAATLAVSPGVPLALSPKGNQGGIPVEAPIVWSRVSGALRYQLQLSSDSTFATMEVNDSTLTDTTDTLAALAYETFYFWRVRAGNGAGWSQWSSRAAFRTLLAVPSVTIVAPLDGDTVKIEDVLFTWRRGSSYPDYYHLQVADDSLMTSIVVEETQTIDTGYTATGISNGRYWWRVRGHNNTGWGEFTEPVAFTLAAPSTRVLPADFAVTAQGLSGSKGRLVYALPVPCDVEMVVYDVRGRLVCTLVDGPRKAGYHAVRLAPAALSRGRYVLSFSAGAYRRRELLLVID
ncbi:MAG: hypothetical protein GF331_18690 [Chitinivibrionales bacterium]|nr:hypothetical protein [Chitinivibrionales bacterium]